MPQSIAIIVATVKLCNTCHEYMRGISVCVESHSQLVMNNFLIAVYARRTEGAGQWACMKKVCFTLWFYSKRRAENKTSLKFTYFP